MVRKLLTPGVKPIGGKEHREQQDNQGVGLQGDVQADDLRFPGRMTGSCDLRAIRPYHLVGIGHEEWNENSDGGEDKETNLIIWIRRVRDQVSEPTYVPFPTGDHTLMSAGPWRLSE